MEITGPTYRVWVEHGPTVHFEGTLRLRSSDYRPVMTLLLDALATPSAEVTLDLVSLLYLNSSGINTLYKFAIEVRSRGGTDLTVRAGTAAWQRKTIPNIRRFLPGAKVVLP
jgi:hypothetical protein